MSESFNYIAFGNRDYVAGDVANIEISRGRMFEYTPTDIEKRLVTLNESAIAYLEKLPVFFASEISASDNGFTMLLKYGRVSNITADRTAVTADFLLLADFGEIAFASLEEAQSLFDADRFQLYRTHWAVRKGDALDVLARLIAYRPNLAATVAALADPDVEAAAEPPPATDTKVGTANSVESFLTLLYGLPAADSTESFFRGHEDSNFELTPSLLRRRLDGSWQFLPNEDRLCKEMLIAHYDEFQGDQYCFDRLVRMQHYGLPTRLLDISGNPLVALFFACFGSAEQLNIEGQVIVFRVAADRVKYYDSDTVSCLSNLSNLTYAQKNEIDLTLDRDAFNKSPIAEKLLHHIKSEKGFFEGRINPGDLGSIACVKAKQTNSRIKSQSGAFLLFGHETVLPEAGEKGLEISRIAIVNKPHILDQLDRINVNATTVYPSIDRTAIQLRARYLALPSDDSN